MTITTYQVQNILRTYGRMLGRKRRTAQGVEESSAQTPLDRVDISSGAKRRQVINKIAQEIIGQVTNQPVGRSQNENDALGELSRETGRNLEAFRSQEGGFRFAVVDPETKTILEELSPEENQRLEERLGEIARAIVDRNMVS
jgi:hypothetical protein